MSDTDYSKAEQAFEKFCEEPMIGLVLTTLEDVALTRSLAKAAFMAGVKYAEDRFKAGEMRYD